jgi:uncharacterized oligopeptide transporter (OPT) family protein
VLIKGLGFLHPTAQIAIGVGAVLGIVIEVINKKMKGRFILSGVGIGLAFILRFTDSLAMATGAVLFWFLAKKHKDPASKVHRIFVENHETVCAGGIAGGAIIGIALILLETMLG